MSKFSRLPKTVTPVNYKLWLKPSFETFTFDGKEDIQVKINDSTRQIVLNGAEIEVLSAVYTASNNQVFETFRTNYDEEKEEITFEFEKTLEKGEGVLKLEFKGELNNKMRGFYRSQYMADGVKKYAAVTQFEACDARRSFPCWDEPAIKATFDVTLVVPKNLVALSNMNVISEMEDGSCKITRFSQTPVMSTYIIAFIVGEFDYVEEKTTRGMPVRVYTPPGKSEQGCFALDIAVKALAFYEDYFKVDFLLPKMDLIAIADFALGAMENWGLVTYKESALLFDDANSSAKTKQWISLIVCHELAHMWFGNLVTMEWWTNLWLKEGFASFMEYLATDHWYPEFDIWSSFMSDEYKRGMDLDALDNSHPIEVPVGHPKEVNQIFDAISYSKGASVIRMLHNWVGDESFSKGLHNYLTKFAYKDAVTEDLWEALEGASGKPVTKVMPSWTKQMGYPIIDVSCTSRTDNSITLQLSQKKFNANQANCSEDTTPQKWFVPLSFSTAESGGRVAKSVLLEDTTMGVTLENVSRKSWVKVNPSSFGFYRVKYSEDLLQLLLSAVETKSLQPRDRLNIENDLFALSSSGVISTTDFLQALSSYKKETDYAVWCDLNANVGSLSVLLWQDAEAHERFKKLILKLYKSTYDHLGWDSREGESHLDSLLRSMMISRCGSFGDEDAIREARERFERHRTGIAKLDANLRSSVYSIVLKHGRRAEFEQLLQMHDSEDLHEEKERIERCLGYVSEESLLKEALDFAMSDKVRDNDKVFLLGSVASESLLGQEIAWKFVKENWEKLNDLFKETSTFLAKVVKLTSVNLSTEEMALDFQDFFTKNPIASADRTIKQSIENIRRKADWWKRDGEAISDWVKNLN